MMLPIANSFCSCSIHFYVPFVIVVYYFANVFLLKNKLCQKKTIENCFKNSKRRKSVIGWLTSTGLATDDEARDEVVEALTSQEL